ncbi:MAG: 4-alpha-glucanotransferase [Lachnospirales bacterium]
MGKKNRESGILMPISSIPSNYGIGAFSKEAYDFVDMLEKSGQKNWQVLPLGPTSYGDSPYQSFSTFAGNPYFIDLDTLVSEGLLEKKDIEDVDFGDDDRNVNYSKLYNSRFKVLRIAFENWKKSNENKEIDLSVYLKEYCLYMAIKNKFDNKEWLLWDDDIKYRSDEAIKYYKDLLADDILFYEFLQMNFFKQWKKLKNYANIKGVNIIGDIPIYVALDSADCWLNTHLFDLNDDLTPITVAGCPPDKFTSLGQMWGNPIYNWEKHKETGYSWWIKRIEQCFEIYDVLRIDHFRGFDEYYAIPYADDNAVNGKWEKGPGMDFFNTVKKELGDVNIIAEDLGYITDTVEKLLHDTKYPGMKVIEFAFDSREESDYLPYNYIENSVVYTGTHDNDTIVGWYKNLNKDDKEKSLQYLDNYDSKDEEIHWDFIRLALSSVSKLAVIPMQDYIGLDSDCRINTPSTIGCNWTWRMKKNEFSNELSEKIKCVNNIYGR